jgi:hypothetical protein
MKNEIAQTLAQATQTLKDTVAQAFGEIKANLDEKLGILATVKKDLAVAYDDLAEIDEIMSDFTSEMTDMCEEVNGDIIMLEDLLYNLDPEYFEEICAEEDTEEEDTEEEDTEEEDTDTNESDFGVAQETEDEDEETETED